MRYSKFTYKHEKSHTHAVSIYKLSISNKFNQLYKVEQLTPPPDLTSDCPIPNQPQNIKK